MPRVTRSAALAARNNEAQEPRANGHVDHTDADKPQVEGDNDVELIPEAHIRRALHGVKALRVELESLRKHNTTLQNRLEELEEAPDDSDRRSRSLRARPTVTQLLQQVRNLKDEVKKLQKERSRDKRKIEQLKMKEIAEDAADLEEAAFEVGDDAYRMRKLLRRFHDLMVSTSLDEDEKCAICFEPLEPGKSVSLPCDHTYCSGCLASVARDFELVRCPHCRSEYPREEIETVQYTASQQWDELLKVAMAWAKADRRREEDTSEEEAEEEFINDAQTTVSTSESSALQDAVASPEPDEAIEKPQPTEEPLSEDAPRTPLKKRRAIFSGSSPEPDGDDPGSGVASTSADVQAADESGGLTAAQPSTPPTQVQPTTPTYAQTPKAEKRQLLQSLAASRSAKKSRIL